MANIFIKTYGCTFNQADSEVMAGILESSGHKIAETIEKADAVIVNSCTVKNSAEAKLFTFLKNIKAKYPEKKIIAAGCVGEAHNGYLNDEKKLKNYSVIGVDNIDRIADVVEKALAGEILHIVGNRKLERLNIPKIRKNKAVEIVPINSGCLGSCAYCKAKQARGELFSYSMDAIIRHIKCALEENISINWINGSIKEIWLTSQDTGAYGKDIGSSIPELLREIIKIPGDFKIRLGMCNPNFMLEYLDDIIEIMKNEIMKNDKEKEADRRENNGKIFKFLHIPVQAGSNDVLKNMGRKYCAKDYYKIIKKLKQNIPEITISTDIICGFPEETEEQFEESLELVRKTKPDVLNISRFWARPGTKAAKMKQLNPNIIKERSERLRNVFEKAALENNMEWLGWEGEVIIDEQGKQETNTSLGRNYCYKPVVVKGKHKIGGKVKVKIENITPFDLRDF